MEGILPLALLLGASGSVLYMSRKSRHNRGVREGYNNLLSENLAHSAFVQRSAELYNPLQNLIPDINNNPLLPVDPTSQQIKDVNNRIQSALGNVTVNASGTEQYILGNNLPRELQVASVSNNETLRKIQFCEKTTGTDETVYTKEFIESNCGVCHKGGVTHKGDKQNGGLYIEAGELEDIILQANNSGRKPTFKPTVGQCDAGFFTTNPTDTRKLNQRLKCDAEQRFSDTCMQAYQNGKFIYVGDNDTDYTVVFPKLYLVGDGKCAVSVNNIQIAPTPPENGFDLSLSPREINLGQFTEGKNAMLRIFPATEGGQFSISGYLEGQTQTGVYRVDINKLIQQDTQTGKKPRVIGGNTIGGRMFTKLTGAPQIGVADFLIYNPFTFLSFIETSFVTADNASTPFISKQLSAQFLESSPCYKKGQAPGSYSMQCLQSIFTNAGCTEAGNIYPDTPEKAAALQTRENGTYKDISEIATEIVSLSAQTYSGKDLNGQDLSIPDWDEKSKKCTGKPVSNPCTYDPLNSGPLSPNCLAYLYRNDGIKDRQIGSTYTGGTETSSLREGGLDNQFCTPAGTLSPENANMKDRQNAIAIGQRIGGLEAVKNFYNRIHTRANNNGLPDSERRGAIKQCYGTTLTNQLTTTRSTDLQRYSKYVCTPAKFADSITGTGVGFSPGTKPIQVIQILSNWVWTFTLRVTSKQPGNAWGAVIIVSRTGDDNPSSDGSRNPGVYLAPGTSTPNISLVNKSGQIVYFGADEQLELNTDYSFALEFRSNYNGNGTLSMSFGKSPNTMRTKSIQTPGSSSGNASVFIGQNPFYSSFTGIMSNISYCTNDTVIENPMDNPDARTKIPRVGVNFKVDPALLMSFNKPVFVIGNYGDPPWGTWFVSGFPNPTSAKWIWNSPTGNQWTYNSDGIPIFFIKLFTVTNDNPVKATLWIGADNNASVVLNNTDLGSFSQKQTFEITLFPGQNLVSIAITNTSGPAGLVVDCKDKNGDILFVSDDSWKTR